MTSSDKSKNRHGTGCGSLVLILVFGLPGIILSLLIFSWNLDATKQSRWTKREAMIDAMPEISEDGGFPISQVEYNYSYEGRTYYNSQEPRKFGFTTSGGGTVNEDWLAANSANLDGGHPVPCWIDPANPENSRLIRNRSSFFVFFLLIFSFTHGLPGIASLYFRLNGTDKKEIQIDSNIDSFPLEPLKWRPEWGEGFTTSERSGFHFILGIASLLWINGCLWPGMNMLFSPSPDIAEMPWVKQPNPWLTAVIVLPGVMIPWFFFRELKIVKINRDLLLRFPTTGFVTGSETCFVLSCKTQMPECVIEHGCRWRLTCRESVFDSEGAETDTKKLYQFDLQPEGSREIHFSVTIPTEAPASSKAVKWQVHGTTGSKLPVGPFPVPVLEERGI